jgi:hypothetical protein
VATALSTPRAKNLALLLLAMTQFVVVIDASIVNVALPSIGRALHHRRRRRRRRRTHSDLADQCRDLR